MPSSKKRLRHIETTSRLVFRRRAISSLSIPFAAMSTILARTTSRYADVYFRARASSASCVIWSRMILYGLFLGMGSLLSEVTLPYNLRRCNYNGDHLAALYQAASLTTASRLALARY